MASSADAPSSTGTNPNSDGAAKERRRKRRWGAATPASDAAPQATTTVTTSSAPAGAVDSKAKALALKASIAARLAALKSKTKPAAAAAAVVGNKRPPPASNAASSSSAPPVAKRAKHYELDMTVTGPTFQKSTAVAKPKVNPYLAHMQEETKESEDGAGIAKDSSDHKYVDARLEAAGHNAALKKIRRRELRFVEPGTFVDIAERKRQRAANAESAGFASGRKAGQYFRSSTIGSTSSSSNDYYGTTQVLDDVEDKGVLAPRAEIGGATLENKSGSNLRAMPMVVEWWDLELLPSKLKKQVSTFEGSALSKATQSQMQQFAGSVKKETESKGEETAKSAPEPSAQEQAETLRQKCSEQVALSHSKTASLIQHIVPIPPPGEVGKKPAEPVLYLTKKERKRARKRRREQKQRELQDLQAAGLIEAPEPRLTLQNFIRVMGDQAYVDPSQMERKVQEQVQKRQLAHLERNAAKKLTKDQRVEKIRARVNKDATPSSNATGAIHVALFYVKNVSHRYHRTKLDLNAQQMNITGGVLECDIPNVSCVVCEGGPKAIKKYQRLMLFRMHWKGPDEGDDESDEDEEDDNNNNNNNNNNNEDPDKPTKQKFDKENRCELVWTGLSTKRQFKGFVFQHCETSAQTRKVLKSKGVGHYWDQVLAYASGSGDHMHLKLVESDDDDSDDEKETSAMDTSS